MAAYTFHDYLGLLGVFITLIAYVLISIRKMNPIGLSYPSLNAIGSLLIIYSLLYKWNPASWWMEISWLLVSLYGVYQAMKHQRNARKKTIKTDD